MHNNDITTVRKHLLNVLSDVCDSTKPIDKDRVVAVCSVAQAIVDTARVEVEYIKATDYIGTGFLEAVNSTKDIRKLGHTRRLGGNHE